MTALTKSARRAANARSADPTALDPLWERTGDLTFFKVMAVRVLLLPTVARRPTLVQFD